MIKENTIIHGNAKYIVRFGEIRIGLPGQQPVKFLKYDEANKLIADCRKRAPVQDRRRICRSGIQNVRRCQKILELSKSRQIGG